MHYESINSGWLGVHNECEPVIDRPPSSFIEFFDGLQEGEGRGSPPSPRPYYAVFKHDIIGEMGERIRR